MEITVEDKMWGLRRDEFPFMDIFSIQKPALECSKKKGILPVFAMDKLNAATIGAKKYIVGSYEMMFMNMANENNRLKKALLYYELFLVGIPCHFHVDAEWYFLANPSISKERGSEICAHFVDFVAEFLCEYEILDGNTGKRMPCAASKSDVTVTILDGITDTKWSAHLIFWIAGGTRMFANNYHCGEVMRAIFRKAKDIGGEEFFFSPEKNPNGEKIEFFADMGIYTKNRVYRLAYCCKEKPGKTPWPLIPVLVNGNANKQDAHIPVTTIETLRKQYLNPPIELNENIFKASIVQRCPTHGISSILKCIQSDGSEPMSKGLSRSSNLSPSDVPRRQTSLIYDDPERDSVDTRQKSPDGLEFWSVIAQHISEVWKDDNKQTLTFGWYNKRTKTIRITSNGRICRVKEEFLKEDTSMTEEQRRTHNNSIWFEINLRSKTWYQGCYCKKNTCMIINELTGDSCNRLTEEYPLPEQVHEPIEKFLNGTFTENDEMNKLVDGFFDNWVFYNDIPLDVKRGCE